MFRKTIFVALLAINIFHTHAMSGDGTYYDVSAGYTACGTLQSNSDMVAAISFDWWTSANPNADPNCGKSVTITDSNTGNSVVVQIMDKCGGCQHNDIDMTPAAFQALGENLSAGRIKVDWEWN